MSTEEEFKWVTFTVFYLEWLRGPPPRDLNKIFPSAQKKDTIRKALLSRKNFPMSDLVGHFKKM